MTELNARHMPLKSRDVDVQAAVRRIRKKDSTNEKKPGVRVGPKRKAVYPAIRSQGRFTAGGQQPAGSSLQFRFAPTASSRCERSTLVAPVPIALSIISCVRCDRVAERQLCSRLARPPLDPDVAELAPPIPHSPSTRARHHLHAHIRFAPTASSRCEGSGPHS